MTTADEIVKLQQEVSDKRVKIENEQAQRFAEQQAVSEDLRLAQLQAESAQLDAQLYAEQAESSQAAAAAAAAVSAAKAAANPSVPTTPPGQVILGETTIEPGDTAAVLAAITPKETAPAEQPLAPGTNPPADPATVLAAPTTETPAPGASAVAPTPGA